MHKDNSIIKMSAICECPRFDYKCPSLSNSQVELRVQRVNFLAKSKFKEANLHNQIHLLLWVKVQGNESLKFILLHFLLGWDSARALPDGWAELGFPQQLRPGLSLDGEPLWDVSFINLMRSLKCLTFKEIDRLIEHIAYHRTEATDPQTPNQDSLLD